MQPGEGGKAFEAFVEYRDLGPVRSVSIVAGRLEKSGSLIGRWCGEWGWVERTAAWDADVDRKARDMIATDRMNRMREMREGHASLGHALTQVAAVGLEQYAGDTGAAKARKLSAVELARIADVGMKMERLAMGDTTERIEVQQAMAALEPFLDLALSYLPPEAQEAFLMDVDERLGVGTAAA